MKTDKILAAPPDRTRSPYRFLPVIAVLASIALAWALGLHTYLSLSAIAENREALRSLVSFNFTLSIAAYALIYVLATVLLLPGAALLTILGGFLFGWHWAAPVTILAATMGATLIFRAARSSFSDLLVRKGGSLVNKLACGFAADAFSYLLFLRLVPVFPFFVVNIAPALCNVKTRTFFLATLIGIAPATIAYAMLGSGLDSIIQSELMAERRCLASGRNDCALVLHPAELLTPSLIAAFLLLGVLALVPPLIKRLRGPEWIDGKRR